jgi:WD40 repeat protein
MKQLKAASILLGFCACLLAVPFRGVAQDAPELVLPTGHTAAVTSVAFSPDGRYALSGSHDATLKLWEISTGREVRSFSGHTTWVKSVAFSPDGLYALSGSSDKTLKFWDVSTGRNVRSFSGHTHTVTSVAFSPDGLYALSGSYDKTLKLWNVSTGREIHSFFGHTDIVNSVAFSPDGSYALSGSSDKTMRLWYVSTGKEERSFHILGHKSPVYSVAFSPDGRFALANLDGKTLKLWNLETGREARSFSGRTDQVNSVVFSPDGRYAIAGCGDGTLKLWDVFTGRKVWSFGREGSVLSVAFSPDGRYVISGAGDGTLKLWDVVVGREMRSFSGHATLVNSVAFSPNGRYALSGSQDSVLKLWDVSTGREIHSFFGHRGQVTSVAFSPDNRYAISGSADKTMKLWDVISDREVRSFSGRLAGHRGSVASVAFSPDGRYVLSGSHDKTLKLWNMSTGQNIRSFSGHTDQVMSVAFSPDGRYALSGSWDCTLKLWDVATGREVHSFSGHRKDPTRRALPPRCSVWSVAFSPDGRYALSGSYDRTLKLWDVFTGKEIRSFSGHTGGEVWSVAFNPDGRYILSGSADETLKLWDMETGQEVRTFSGHTDQVSSVAFSPDGRYALSSSWDRTVKLWDIATGELLLTRLHLDQTDWVAVTPDGRFDGSPDGMRLMHYAKDNKSIPLEALFDRFYVPNLVAQVFSGEELAPDAPDIRKGIEMPPLVRILSPEAGQTLRDRMVEVVVEAVGQGGGVEDIRLYHNDKWIGGEERGMKLSAQPSERVQRTFSVSLVSGMNRLRATAFSRDRTEAHPFEVAIEVKIAEATADLYIVAVGINTYKNSKYNLNYCVSDAQAVVDCLSKRGQGIFRGILVQTAFDEQAARSGIEAALKRVEQDARPEDVFVLYYAGHGVMSEGTKQKPADFYLVPTDVTQMYGNDALLAEKGISAAQLKEISQRIEARKQLVILDACQSGAVVDAFAMRGAAEEKAIAQLARSAGLTVLAAALSKQLATEFKELGHGLFTYTLLQGIEGGADGSPKDGRVTVSELSGYVQARIPELSKRYRGEPQYPNVYVRGQDFPVSVP